MADRTYRWQLTKYARKIAEPVAGDESVSAGTEDRRAMPPPPPPVPGPPMKNKTVWQHIEPGERSLDFALTHNHHLLVTRGATILENISLLFGEKRMQGFYQGDALLIVHFVGSKREERRFRVAFQGGLSRSGTEACDECIQLLGKYITLTAFKPTDIGSKSASSPKPEILEGVVPIPKLAQALTSKNLMQQLPLAYGKARLPDKHLDTLIRLCLTDENFPDLVQQVEEELNKIMKA